MALPYTESYSRWNLLTASDTVPIDYPMTGIFIAVTGTVVLTDRNAQALPSVTYNAGTILKLVPKFLNAASTATVYAIAP
jgi:hypothetical protein